jgi:Regulator of ribonuclease activity B
MRRRPGLLGLLFLGRRRPPRDAASVDQHVVKQLRGLGADLTRPRHVRHFLYFEQEGFARVAAEQIERADYTTTVTAPSDTVSVWTVCAEGYRVIGEDTVSGFRAWFEQIAAELEGEYDGWEPATKP